MKARRQYFRLAAALPAAWLAAAWLQTITVAPLDSEPGAGPYARTGLPHSRTVVSNQHGIFAAYIHDSDEALTAAKWRLARSTDGGKTFTIVYAGENGTSAPVLETDRRGNIYLIFSDVAHNQAHLLRFLAANNFANPTSLTLPEGDAQKFTAAIDEARGRLYYVAMHFNRTTPVGKHIVWFFTIPLDGSRYSRVLLTQPGAVAEAGYPYLYVDERDHLYAAWTTTRLDNGNYDSIHFMRSRDGGAHWETLNGTSLKLPVVADHTGPAHEVNFDSERDRATWLWTMIVKQGKLHFVYRLSEEEEHPMHYVRFDAATGQRDRDVKPVFGGPSLVLRNRHGSCATRRERRDKTIYCVSSTNDNRLAVVVTTDNGQTWQDYAVTSTAIASTREYFGITAARQITRENELIGAYVQLSPSDGKASLEFFKVPAKLIDRKRAVAQSEGAVRFPHLEALDESSSRRNANGRSIALGGRVRDGSNRQRVHTRHRR